MNLSAIAARLAAQNLGQLGKSLFVTEMPTGCHQGILLMDAYNGTPINHELPGYHVTDFRLVVRHTDYAAGEALAKQASSALTVRAETAVGDMLVKQMLPANLPRPYRRSAGGYWEFEVDVDVNFAFSGT